MPLRLFILSTDVLYLAAIFERLSPCFTVYFTGVVLGADAAGLGVTALVAAAVESDEAEAEAFEEDEVSGLR